MFKLLATVIARGKEFFKGNSPAKKTCVVQMLFDKLRYLNCPSFNWY